MTSDNFSLKPGDYAPDFTLDISGGDTLTLSNLKDKNVILYFYPKDNTPGCTREAQDFAENHDAFNSCNTVIIGISKDSVKSHDGFIEKYNLPFVLAADVDTSVCEAYGVWVEKMNYGKTYMGIQRSTFLIGKNGIVKKVWDKVKVEGHVEEVLETVRDL